MKKILLVYGDIRTVNIGDYIQSLAAKQYFDDEDYELVNRDELGLYSGAPAKVIMNTWLTYKPENWPPSNKITPLFVALHINSSVEKIMLSPENIGYFKKYEPIGCRDIYTMNLFKSRGVDAYFSSCLTTTLDLTYKVPKHREGIYIVDPLAYMPNGKGVIEILKTLFQTILNVKSVLHIIRNYRKNNKYELRLSKIGVGRILLITKSYLFLRKLLDKDVFDQAIFITQYHEGNEYKSEEERFLRANELLRKYASAKYVITSRIHCALPCLGFQTPVIYIRNLEEGKKSTCRLGGLGDFFNVVEVQNTKIISKFFDGKLKADFCFKNKDTYKIYHDSLIEKCLNFIKNGK